MLALVGAGRRVGIGFVLVFACVVAGCSSGHGRAQSQATTSTGPQLPPGALHWLRSYSEHSGTDRATSADWVLTTRDKVGPLLGHRDSNTERVYLIDLHGHFAGGRCQIRASPHTPCAVGTNLVVSLDESRLIALDSSLLNHAPRLSTLGPVGHVAL